MSTLIKICGLSRTVDVEYVNEARADYCGFIINFPKSHRSVTPDKVRDIRRSLNIGTIPVGVFVDQPVELVAELLEEGTILIAQLHGSEDEDYIARLRKAAPGFPIWKAFKIRSQEDLKAAEASSASVVLLDSGAGSGETFDWSLLKDFPRPYILAGGLTPENIPQAIETAHPFCLDISSGVETDKKKDRNKILAAVAAARKE